LIDSDGNFIPLAADYLSPADGRETNCMKEFLLSESTDDESYFVLNSDSLIGED